MEQIAFKDMAVNYKDAPEKVVDYFKKVREDLPITFDILRGNSSLKCLEVKATITGIDITPHEMEISSIRGLDKIPDNYQISVNKNPTMISISERDKLKGRSLSFYLEQKSNSESSPSE